jgi:V8-like Glu-specific endopeptidase
MKKTQLVITLSLGMLTFQSVIANETKTDIIYGEDNRIETYQANKQLQKLAASTAGMINTIKTIKVGKNTMLPPYTISDDMGLCETERFADQPSAVSCSGFLVGPDLLVTAGHCIQTQKDCDDVTWVFDYKVKSDSEKTDILVPSKDTYKCSKVIESKLFSSYTLKKDYALIKLDRVVKGRTPLKFRTSGKVALKTDLTVIGHPSGLPQKVGGGAKVLSNGHDNYFKTNLDTFGGNSGSAVFNTKTGLVEGILVRGAKDYDKVGGCLKVHKTTEEITDFKKYGEAVTRISEITTLKNRGLLFKAIEDGDIEKVKELGKVLKEISIYDNNMENALHVAIKSQNDEITKAIISLGIDINAKNLLGQTPLHLAALSGSTKSARILINNNADTLALDNMGKTPRQLANFYKFSMKSSLKKAEIMQKKKKSL